MDQPAEVTDLQTQLADAQAELADQRAEAGEVGQLRQDIAASQVSLGLQTAGLCCVHCPCCLHFMALTSKIDCTRLCSVLVVARPMIPFRDAQR